MISVRSRCQVSKGQCPGLMVEKEVECEGGESNKPVANVHPHKCQRLAFSANQGGNLTKENVGAKISTLSTFQTLFLLICSTGSTSKKKLCTVRINLHFLGGQQL